MDRKQLKEWMEKTGKTVQDIVRGTKLNQSTVYRFLSGTKNPHPGTVSAIQDWARQLDFEFTQEKHQ